MQAGIGLKCGVGGESMEKIRKNCISVIVAIYNMAPYLDRCIQSLLCQTYKDLEILLVNDGSTDGSRDICEKYRGMDSRIVLYDKDNGGISDARNYGLERSNGEYLAFVDPDDWIEDTFFNSLVDQMEREKADIACVGFDYVYDEKYKMPDRRVKNTKMTQKQCMSHLCRNKWFTSHVWNKLYRREVFEGIRFPCGKNYEDIAVMHELIMSADIIMCSSEILYHYFMRPESIIHVKSAKNELDNFQAYLKRFREVKNRAWKRSTLKCCAWAAYQILFLSKNQFAESEYKEVRQFWITNTTIRFLGIKYSLMYTFPYVYKKLLRL